MRILVNCVGFIGDCLFASSLAKKLKEKYPGCYVIYNIPLPQPELLLKQNPYIDQVVIIGTAIDSVGTIIDPVDMTINIPVVDQRFPATIQMQAAAGIDDQSTEFDVWTVPEHDKFIEHEFALIKGTVNNLKIIAYQEDWTWRAYQCTPETLAQGIGAPHRNIKHIIEQLDQYYFMIPVGFNRYIPSNHPTAQNPNSYARVASLIKAADWFIGAEGGLSNLAAAVGTKCIITTDFIEQNYGPNGRLRQCNPPMMGPATYYPNAGHVHLWPCISDEFIPTTIKDIIDTDGQNYYQFLGTGSVKLNHLNI